MSLYCPERLLSTRELTDRARGDGREQLQTGRHLGRRQRCALELGGSWKAGRQAYL